jgi:Rha family phage regulatory protein
MDAVTEKVVRLREIDGVIYASSRTIADDFGKRHDHVLRDIQAVIQTLPPDLGTRWFRADRYYEQASNRKGRALSCFDLTRDGWVQVVRRWTNSKANAWFLAYQLKFNEMEGKLGAGAKTEALFDRNKRDNVVSFEGPPKAQAELKLGHAELGRQVRAGTLLAIAATIATGQHPLPKLRLHPISTGVVALVIRDKAGAATSRALALIVGTLVDDAGAFAVRAGLHAESPFASQPAAR